MAPAAAYSVDKGGENSRERGPCPNLSPPPFPRVLLKIHALSPQKRYTLYRME